MRENGLSDIFFFSSRLRDTMDVYRQVSGDTLIVNAKTKYFHTRPT